METNDETKEPKIESKKPRLELRFVCPTCGSRDLLITLLCACYPTSMLDYLEVDPDCLEDSEIHDKEPYDYHKSSHNDGWEFQCTTCGRTPEIEIEGKKRPVENEEELAEWLLKNCPQTDEDVRLPRNGEVKAVAEFAVDRFGQAGGSKLCWWFYFDYKRHFAGPSFEFLQDVEDVDKLQSWLQEKYPDEFSSLHESDDGDPDTGQGAWVVNYFTYNPSLSKDFVKQRLIEGCKSLGIDVDEDS